jgi:hypothetical protein
MTSCCFAATTRAPWGATRKSGRSLSDYQIQLVAEELAAKESLARPG